MVTSQIFGFSWDISGNAGLQATSRRTPQGYFPFFYTKDFSFDGEPTIDLNALYPETGDDGKQISIRSDNIISRKETEDIQSAAILLNQYCTLHVVSGTDDKKVQLKYDPAIAAEDLRIYLPRTMGAWGSGKHPTTQPSCQHLAELHEYVRNNEILDFGCGSGILTILSAILGCSRAVGVDIEPSAVEGSRYNAANGVEQRCAFYLPPAEFLRNGIDFFCRYGDWSSHAEQLLPADDGPFGLVIANILPGPLLRLAPLLCRLCRPGGFVCLAGLRPFQADALRAAYAACGVALAPVGAMRDEGGEEWVSLRGVKGGAPPAPPAPPLEP